MNGQDRILPTGEEELEERTDAALKGALSTHDSEDRNGSFKGKSEHAVADGDWVFVQDDVDGVALGIETVGEFSGEELVERGGEAPDVGDGFGKIDVGAIHAAEQEGIVLGEGEGFGGAVGTADLEVDGGHEVKAEMKRKMWSKLPHSLTTVVEDNRQPEGEKTGSETLPARPAARRHSHF